MDDTIKIVESLEKSGLPIDGKKAFLDLAVPLAKDNLLKSGTKVTSFVLDKFERKISGKDVVRSGKEFTLFISNEVFMILLKSWSH